MTTANGVSFLNNKGTTWTTLLNLVYPVGSVYLTRKILNSFSPGGYFGGGWTKLENGRCLRTSTGSSCGSGGSDKHVHSAAGPSDWSTTEGQNYGVRTSMAWGGANRNDTAALTDAGGGVIWSRWAPCKAGTLNEHPAFNPAVNKGYDDGNGIAFTIKSCVGDEANGSEIKVWGDVHTGNAAAIQKANNPEAIIDGRKNTMYLENLYDSNGTYGSTLPGCYGWTRPNSQAGKYRWDNQGEYNGDGTVPVAYYDVYAYERTS